MHSPLLLGSITRQMGGTRIPTMQVEICIVPLVDHCRAGYTPELIRGLELKNMIRFKQITCELRYQRVLAVLAFAGARCTCKCLATARASGQRRAVSDRQNLGGALPISGAVSAWRTIIGITTSAAMFGSARAHECVATYDRSSGAIIMHLGEPRRMAVNVPSATDRHTRVNKFEAILAAPADLSLKVRIRRDIFNEGDEIKRSGVRLWFQGSKVIA